MLAGSLTEFSLPDVFSLLAATRKTGLLHLTGDDGAGRVWILDGGLAFAAADVTRAPLVARLLHGGEIAEDDVDALVAAQAADAPGQMAAALTDAGLPADRVTELLQDQVIDAVFDLSRWTDGDFAFEATTPAADAATPTTPTPTADAATPTVTAADVLEAVAVRIAEWDGIVAQLPSPSSVLRPVSRPATSAAGMVQMSAAQWEVFTLVDGARSVSQLIALTGQGQFVVARLLAGLVADGLLAVRDDVGEQTPSERRAQHLAEAEHRVLGAIEPVVIPPVRVPAKPTPTPKPASRAPATADPGAADGPAATGATAAATAAGPSPTAPAAATASADGDRAVLDDGAPSAEDSASADADAEPTLVPTSDLLSRLIDGVRGA